MKLYQEDVEKHEKVLLIFSKKRPLVSFLTNTLKANSIDVFASTTIPEYILEYKCIFFFDKFPKTLTSLNSSPTIIFITQSHDKNEVKRVQEQYKNKIKIIRVSPHTTVQQIDTILAFAFSQSPDSFLDISHVLKQSNDKIPPKRYFQTMTFLSKKRVLTYCLLLFLLVELLFLLPLSVSSLFLYKAVGNLRKNNIAQATTDLSYAKPFLDGAQTLYSFARPTLSFFSLALVPDTLISTVNNTYDIAYTAIDIEKKAGEMIDLIMTQNKTHNQIAETRTTIAYLQKDIRRIYESTLDLTRDLDSLPIQVPDTTRQKINSALSTMEQVQQLSNNFDTILGGKKSQKYILFFYNNMELRPGGGFLGSYATVNFDQYTMGELTVYDVYDADGQLKVHIEPPVAIRDYLEQPHWFLRDSNFSPDFPENVRTAQVFLEKEIGFTDFDGAIGITTTGITNLLSQFGTLYLPDYQESVDKNNFYLKTQEHAQNNFFPGSTQKKSFLSSLVHAMILHVADTDKAALSNGILQSLDEKQIVLYFADTSIQDTIDKAGWSGAVLQPACVKNTTCIINSILPVDANVGVNKANFFVSREFSIATIIENNGAIRTIFSTNIQNDSPNNAFGGDYKNFFRLYIPRSAIINEVRLNNHTIESFQEKSTAYFKTVEILVTTKKGAKDKLEVVYSLNQKLKPGKNTYQLAIQKQIGTANTATHMTISFPNNIVIGNKNFPAVAKNGSIAYNTTLSGNKLFIVELNRQ